ncbi:hypothetical protein FJZ40_05290, partial [Candidatus Shapirobacteria bacterium]|nr:hypothetical protein [Candidatus Shapirobacteria bacterium]
MEENNLQAQPPIVTEPKPVRSWLKIVLFVALGVILVGGLVFAGIQIGKISNLKSQIAKPQLKTQNQEIPTLNPINSWKTFRIDTLNIEFKLPPQISNKNWEEKLLNGDRGKMLCFQVTEANDDLLSRMVACGSRLYGTLTMGGPSVNYTYGREGGFMDLQGFEKIGDKYYTHVVNNRKFEIPRELVSNFDSPNGLAIIKIRGEQDDTGDFPVQGTPGEGYLGAIINTGNPTYPGLSIVLILDKDISEETFDQILSTFKFLDQSETAETAGWKVYTSTKHKVTFKYPASWYILSEDQKIMDGTLVVAFSTSDPKSGGNLSGIEIVSYSNSGRIPLIDWWREQMGEGEYANEVESKYLF